MFPLEFRFREKKYIVNEDNLLWIFVRDIDTDREEILHPLEWDSWEDQFQPTNCYELAKEVSRYYSSPSLYNPSTLESVNGLSYVAYKCIQNGDEDGIIEIEYAYIYVTRRPAVMFHYSARTRFYAVAMWVKYLAIPVPVQLWESYGFKDDWVSECLDKLLEDLKTYIRENLETIKKLYKYYKFDRFIDVDHLTDEDIIYLAGLVKRD